MIYIMCSVKTVMDMHITTITHPPPTPTHRLYVPFVLGQRRVRRIHREFRQSVSIFDLLQSPLWPTFVIPLSVRRGAAGAGFAGERPTVLKGQTEVQNHPQGVVDIHAVAGQCLREKFPEQPCTFLWTNK